mmetsp:Transcript_28532/g.64548  ORF Transcript_28532/g.64548 Transcript_28532/m.64548 type:complete len:166 (+) Transcript_28532:78-575(+)
MLQNNPPNAGSFRYKTGTTLMVSGLSSTAKKTDIQAAFGDFGHILRIDLEIGKAYVEFEDVRDAEDAKAEMDGKKLLDRRIKIEKSGAREVNTNTPRHGAKGIHTVDRSGLVSIEARNSEGPAVLKTSARPRSQSSRRGGRSRSPRRGGRSRSPHRSGRDRDRRR